MNRCKCCVSSPKYRVGWSARWVSASSALLCSASDHEYWHSPPTLMNLHSPSCPNAWVFFIQATFQVSRPKYHWHISQKSIVKSRTRRSTDKFRNLRQQNSARNLSRVEPKRTILVYVQPIGRPNSPKAQPLPCALLYLKWMLAKASCSPYRDLGSFLSVPPGDPRG